MPKASGKKPTRKPSDVHEPPRTKVSLFGKFVDEMQLNGKPKTVEALKFLIHDIVREEFDTKLPFRKQDPSLISLKRKLSQQYPEIFEHCELSQERKRGRMQTAIIYARLCFTEARKKYVKGNGATGDKKTIIDYSSAEIVDLTGDSPGPPDIASSRPQTRRLLATLKEQNAPKTNYSLTRFLKPQQSQRIKTEGPNDIIIPPFTTCATSVDRPDSHTNEVADFLQNCVPDMRFLLDSFLAFGCRNRGFLESVAKSDDVEIEDFIKTVLLRYPPAHMPGTLLEMDIWVLKQHFKHYLTT